MSEILHTDNYLELLLKGGWALIPIAILLFIGIFVFFDRLLIIQKASKIDFNFMNRIRDYIHDGKIDVAVNLCQNTDSPIAKMIEKGISRIGRPLSDVHLAIENSCIFELYKLKKRMFFLPVAAISSFLIGFLGTILGIAHTCFNSVISSNILNIKLFTHEIGMSLFSTEAGLIVSIITTLAYFILKTQLRKVIHLINTHTADFMDLLNEPAR
jgi:biopolymer transport protein ExbB